jgi:ParB-like chromosome segregation protein Spo0J
MNFINIFSSKKLNNDLLFMKVDEIKTHPELSGLFLIQKEVLDKIISSIKEKGFDPAERIVIGKIEGIGDFVVDGHTRLEGAKQAGLSEVPVIFKNFASFEDAIEYTYKRQANRRNLTQAEILKASQLLKNKTNRDGTGRSVTKLSNDLGISESTLIHAKVVGEKADTEVIDAIYAGKLSINKAYKDVKETKQKKEADNNEVKISSTDESLQTVKTTLVAKKKTIDDDKASFSNKQLKNYNAIIENKKEILSINEKKESKNNKQSINMEEILNFLYEHNEKNAINLLLKEYKNCFSEELFNKLIEKYDNHSVVTLQH